MVLGVKQLGYVGTTRVENRGETTRGGNDQDGNVLVVKLLRHPDLHVQYPIGIWKNARDMDDQVWGISENRDRKLSLECVTMNSPCKGKSLQTSVYWVDQ